MPDSPVGSYFSQDGNGQTELLAIEGPETTAVKADLPGQVSTPWEIGGLGLSRGWS